MTEIQATNRTKVGIAREVTFATVPTSPVFKTQRTTGQPSLAANPKTVVSAEIRSDRQTPDIPLVGIDPGGDIDGELSFAALDDALEEAFFSTWTAKPAITVVTLDTEISDLSATTATVATPLGSPFLVGMLVLFTGFPTAANNNLLARVSSSTATTVVFPGATFTAETVPIPVAAAMHVVGFQGAAGDIVATITNGNGLTSTLLDFTTLGLAVGDWVKVGGTTAGNKFTTTADNDWCRISAITAQRLSFDRVPTGWAADAGAAKTIQVFSGDTMVNGTTERSVTIERQYLDHASTGYEYLTGQELDKLSFTLPSQAIITHKRSYMGANATIGTTRAVGASDVAPPAYAVINSASNVARFGIGGQSVTGPSYVKDLSIEFANNLRRQTAIGNLAAVGIGEGGFDASGTLNVYFGDTTIYSQIIANTASSMNLAMLSQAGNREGYVLDFPTMKYKSGAPTIPGKNQDVMLPNVQWQAIIDATLGYTARITRYWYTPA
jgi:hypothetical protein